MRNSAATFGVDLYERHLRPEASSRRLMVVGRWTTAVLVLVGCLWAPIVGIPVYGLLLWLLPEVVFLHHMAITFVVRGFAPGLLSGGHTTGRLGSGRALSTRDLDHSCRV